MAWRAAGKQLKRPRRPFTGKRAQGRRKPAAMSPVEKRRLLQLAVCCGIFVLLVGVKLLLPERMQALRQSVSTVMDRNMDVGQVFSAVGNMVTGKETVGKSLEEVYEAVFAPEQSEERENEPDGEPADTDAVDAVGQADGELPESGAVSSEETGAEPNEETDAPEEEPLALSYVLYSGENLPENVSMEQAVLGFDYTTPVAGTLSSPFGYREHPVEGEDKFHYGLDIAADTGTAISCFASGEVLAVGESSSYGKYLIVDHNQDYSTLYAHCSSFCVCSGDTVQQGQTIAQVGDTGIATGPHLHFELHRKNTYLNPIYYVSLA